MHRRHCLVPAMREEWKMEEVGMKVDNVERIRTLRHPV
jgi:hypothetical protein